MKTKTTAPKRVERVQVGARMEKSLVKVLRGLADYLDLSLGDLLEGITLHALEGKAPFSAETLAHVKRFKTVHGMTLTAKDSHQLVEVRSARRSYERRITCVRNRDARSGDVSAWRAHSPWIRDAGAPSVWRSGDAVLARLAIAGCEGWQAPGLSRNDHGRVPRPDQRAPRPRRPAKLGRIQTNQRRSL